MDRRSIIIITSGVFTLYSLTVVAFRALWPWRGQSKGLLARCCRFLRRRTPEPEEAETERRVREEVIKRHRERASTFLVLFGGAAAYLSASLMISTAVGIQDPALVPVAIIQFNIFVKHTLSFFPKLLTPRVIDACYLHSIVTIIASLHMRPQDVVTWRIPRLMQFVFWGVFDLNPWLNAFSTLCLVVAEISTTVYSGLSIEPMILFAYVSALCMLLGLGYCLEQGVRFEILATDSKSELTAIQTLLDSICDVVVHLDSQLRLKQHSPKLADVLMRPTAMSLKGADLRGYMATDADREAFATNVTMKDGRTAQANVFHARLRDSSNSNVAMEFFTVDFSGRDGAQHHIVGMREHTDIQPLASQQRAPPPPAVEVVMPRRIRAEGRAQPQRGTPSVTQQWDLRSHRSDPASGSEHGDSDSDSDSSVSFSFQAGSPGTRDIVVRTPKIRVMETSYVAKVVTTNYLLMSWALGAAARSSCCPKHAAVADLQRVVASLAKEDCAPDYGPVTDWQCRRCGIKADEHKDPSRKKSKKCLLCQSIDDACFQPSAAEAKATL